MKHSEVHTAVSYSRKQSLLRKLHSFPSGMTPWKRLSWRCLTLLRSASDSRTARYILCGIHCAHYSFSIVGYLIPLIIYEYNNSATRFVAIYSILCRGSGVPTFFVLFRSRTIFWKKQKIRKKHKNILINVFFVVVFLLFFFPKNKKHYKIIFTIV